MTGCLKLNYVRSKPSSNLLGRVPLPPKMGWLRPPRGNGPFRAYGICWDRVHAVLSVHRPKEHGYFHEMRIFPR